MICIPIRHKLLKNILKEMGFSEIPTILVYNKVDRLEDNQAIESLMHENSVAISAKTRYGIQSLLQQIENQFSSLQPILQSEQYR